MAERRESGGQASTSGRPPQRQEPGGDRGGRTGYRGRTSPSRSQSSQPQRQQSWKDNPRRSSEGWASPRKRIEELNGSRPRLNPGIPKKTWESKVASSGKNYHDPSSSAFFQHGYVFVDPAEERAGEL